MKWTSIHPSQDEWVWTDADAIVDFAQSNAMKIKGTTLVWGQAAGNGVPDWLRSITEPTAFRAAVVDAIMVEVSRYAGRVDRWDVVNEPFVYFGEELDQNIYAERIGADYIELAFRTAHAADPNAELWLNEIGTEYLPAKADALIELVRSLKDDGVPIDGVGLQAHFIADLPIVPGSFGSTVTRLRDLGVKVAITEMDVPTGPTRNLQAQADLYAQIVSECLEAGCSEITTWGVSDNETWLDAPSLRDAIPLLDAFSLPSNPLLLDAAYQPKPAYHAVANALMHR